MVIKNIFRRIREFPKDMDLLIEQFEVIFDGFKKVDNWQELTVTFADANTEVAVDHDLQKIPNRMNCVFGTNGMNVEPSDTEWTKTTVYFKSRTASNKAIIRIWAQ
jgi:hypothetical protein